MADKGSHQTRTSTLYCLIFISVLFLASCNQTAKDTILTGRGIISSKAMVVSAHPEASMIGADIMIKGGNAFDAAAATGFALAVCYPNAGNLGGGGLAVLRQSDGNISSVDYREKAPVRAIRDMYLDEDGNIVEGMSTHTRAASGVPGSVAGLIEIHKRYGRLPFRKVIQPAIDIATSGFPISAQQAESLNSNTKRFEDINDHNSISFVKKEQWSEGDLLVQEDLAETLIRIRDKGHDGFYKGITAKLICDEMQKGNGLIGIEDLESYEAIWREPISDKYRNYKIISMPPPSSGGLALIQLMKMTDSYPLSEWGFHSPEAVHLMVEAERRVYADRANYLGDPDFVDVPVQNLIDDNYTLSRMSDFDKKQASRSANISHGVFIPESEETTHYSIVDPEGNAASVTTTLNSGYGNYVVVEGAGFIMNNEMDDFSSKPGFPNIYGLVGGEANSIQAGKRMLSSMTPTILEKDGELFMVIGSPGGSTIITSVFQTILNVTEFGMNMQDAVEAHRFHHQWLPDLISFERASNDSVLYAKLKDMGHSIRLRSAIGRVDAIRILQDGRLEAGADPRGDDSAAGY